MQANTVEAVLKSKYEDGIASGVENTRALMENTLNGMKDASAAAGAGIEAAFNSTVGALENWRTNLSKAADDSDSSFKKMGLGAAAVGIAFAEVFLRGAKAVGDFVIDIMKEASEVAAARVSFEALTAAQGINADQMLGKLKHATDGQVGQLTLLRNANKVMTAELPLTAAQYAHLTENVYALSKSAGTDAVAAQDALTEALIRGQSRALGPAIGIHLAVSRSLGAMSAAMASNADAMPDRATLVKMYNDMITATDAAVSKLPPKFLTLDEVLTQAHNTWHDMLDDFGTAITRSGVMQELFQRVSEAMEGENGSMDKQRQTALAVNDALIGMLHGFASLLKYLGWAAVAWDVFAGATRAAVYAAIGVFAELAQRVLSTVEYIVDALSHLPGAAGRAFQPVVDWLNKANAATQKWSETAYNGVIHSFDGFGAAKAKLDSMSAATDKLANEMEGLRGTVLDGSAGVTQHAEAAAKAAAAAKVLTDETAKYREMLFSLGQSVASPAEKAMNDVVHSIARINQEFSHLDPSQRAELYAAVWAKYDAEETKRLAEEEAKLKAAGDREYELKRQQAQKVLDLDTQFMLQTATEEQKAAIKREQDIRKVAEVVGLQTAEGKRLLLFVEKEYDAAMDKIHAARIAKEQAAAKKELDDAVNAANAITKAVDGVLKGTAPANSALTALQNMPQVLDTLKKKLAELNAQPVVTDAQIAQIQKLKTAIDGLNKLNLTPLQHAFDQMRAHIQQSTAASLQSFGTMLGGMLAGQQVTGAALLQEAGKMIGGLISQMGTMLIQTGVAAVAASLTGMPGPWSMAGGLEAIAEGVALTAIGSALGGASSSAGGGASSAAAPSGSSAQTNQNPQILNVGTPNGANSQPQNQQTQHLVTLQVKSTDSHIVSVVKNDIQTNGQLRVAVKQA